VQRQEGDGAVAVAARDAATLNNRRSEVVASLNARYGWGGAVSDKIAVTPMRATTQLRRRYALVMPTMIYDEQRLAIADQCFTTLLKTDVAGERPLFLLLIKDAGLPYQYPIAELGRLFWTVPRDQTSPDGGQFHWTDQPMVFGCDRAFEMGAEYVVQLGNDTLFHPRWLVELDELIARRPTAAAWSVYRSARTDVHRTLCEDSDGVQVSSINGNGLTLSRAEWSAMNLNWRHGRWPSPLGATLDMWHVSNRPGDRWVTRRSWIEHAGRAGAHARPDIPEYALDFVGT
jgi:hypothetical protein